MGSKIFFFLMMTFALLAPYQILEVCLWQGKSESDIHGTYFFKKFQKSAKKLSEQDIRNLSSDCNLFQKEHLRCDYLIVFIFTVYPVIIVREQANY